MDDLFSAILEARNARIPCATITIAAASGSVPRAIGAKMLVYLSEEVAGTIGGGKLESLAISAAREAIGSGQPLLKTYPLREDEPDSFGAICGGEVTLFIEPLMRREAIFLIGAGHCARAIASLASQCDFHVSMVDDRLKELALCESANQKIVETPAAFIHSRTWQKDEALVLVSRHFEADQEALFAVLSQAPPGYVGMIGSRRKVLRVFDEMRRRGVTTEQLENVYAPIGLDLGADAPMEIAVSVLAEIMQVLRARSGRPLSRVPQWPSNLADQTPPVA